MLITTAILLLLVLALAGHGHPVDSRLDAREYPFFRAAAIEGLAARTLTYEATPAHENELRQHVRRTPTVRVARSAQA
ncbi:hypothetical protein EPN44_03020 [bacterium]|nr:MAG: hypothetical protein EPN44_03020 [bacterium]